MSAGLHCRICSAGIAIMCPEFIPSDVPAMPERRTGNDVSRDRSVNFVNFGDADSAGE